MTKRAHKPHYILVQCVVGGGPFVFGDRYYAIKGHRLNGLVTLDIWLDGEVRTVSDHRFIPSNPANWPLFSHPQRLRWGGYQSDRDRRAA